MSQTVIGIFKNAQEANNAVSQLINQGFNESDVDVRSGSTANSTTENYADSTKTSSDSEGGVSRFFKNLFGNDDESDRYISAAQRGSVVTVHAKSAEQAQKAAMLLDNYGASDVDDDDDSINNGNSMNNDDSMIDAGDSKYDSFTGTAAGNASSYDDSDLSAPEGDQKISVIEETMQVGKREVETGGVRIRSRIVEKPVEESLRLREKQVNVERKAVNRAVTNDDLKNFQDATIEVTEYAEIPVVSKEARVVEEISLGKTVTERNETIRDTVRKTEVNIEETGSNKIK